MSEDFEDQELKESLKRMREQAYQLSIQNEIDAKKFHGESNKEIGIYIVKFLLTSSSASIAALLALLGSSPDFFSEFRKDGSLGLIFFMLGSGFIFSCICALYSYWHQSDYMGFYSKRIEYMINDMNKTTGIINYKNEAEEEGFYEEKILSFYNEGNRRREMAYNSGFISLGSILSAYFYGVTSLIF